MDAALPLSGSCGSSQEPAGRHAEAPAGPRCLARRGLQLLPQLPPAPCDALLACLAMVLGVAVRAGLGADVQLPAASSAQAPHLQAWTALPCVLAAAGLAAWMVKEAASTGSRSGEEPPRRGAGPPPRPRPVWDPLEFAGDDGDECKERWRPLEIKHGHLGLLANAGLVGVRQCPSSSSTELGSSCSTGSPELSSESAESCSSESASELGEPSRQDPYVRPAAQAEALPAARPASSSGRVPRFSSRSGRLWSELSEEEGDLPAPAWPPSASADEPAPEPAPAAQQGGRRRVCLEEELALDPGRRWPLSLEEELAVPRGLGLPGGVPAAPARAAPVPAPALGAAAGAELGVCQPSFVFTQTRSGGQPADSNVPNPVRCRKKPDRDMPLQEILQTLDGMAPCHSLIVRKIKKLGFKSAIFLRAHFEQFGPVDHIYVTHSHLQDRNRPASLGFVVMGSAEGRRAALALGPEQAVRDTTISVGPFEPNDKQTGGQEA